MLKRGTEGSAGAKHREAPVGASARRAVAPVGPSVPNDSPQELSPIGSWTTAILMAVIEPIGTHSFSSEGPTGGFAEGSFKRSSAFSRGITRQF